VSIKLSFAISITLYYSSVLLYKNDFRRAAHLLLNKDRSSKGSLIEWIHVRSGRSLEIELRK
jgi:hypothetical protein